MSTERFLKIILSPVVTEKSTNVGSYGQYVFRVIKDATKPEIGGAVESLFNVKVKAVRIVSVKPKKKRTRQKMGTRKGWKKAYVSLHEGHKIEFSTTQ